MIKVVHFEINLINIFIFRVREGFHHLSGCYIRRGYSLCNQFKQKSMTVNFFKQFIIFRNLIIFNLKITKIFKQIKLLFCGKRLYWKKIFPQIKVILPRCKNNMNREFFQTFIIIFIRRTRIHIINDQKSVIWISGQNRKTFFKFFSLWTMWFVKSFKLDF